MKFVPGTKRMVRRSVSARMPTAFGEFTITVYVEREGREHLAIRMGEPDDLPCLVRIHSECLTGDVFGSVRCDCGEQLQAALEHIAQEGRGLVLYLRQEGRGIGLGNKIRAYALQDQGMDTVQANLHLGFPIDGRTYQYAAAILRDQGVRAVRLATNNPEKVSALEDGGIRVVERVRYDIQARPENQAYLETKVSKMGHLMDVLSASTARPRQTALSSAGGEVVSRLRARLSQLESRRCAERLPSVTLSYAQSLDGSIAAKEGEPLQLSNARSQKLTHQLRSLHDAVLVGINTVLSDDPRLNVRLVAGKNPQPVVLDGRLRFPLDARMLRPSCVPPIVATTGKASASREKRLRAIGVRVVRLAAQDNGMVDLPALLRHLYEIGIRSLMVEGGAQVITNFLGSGLIDQMIVTITPLVVGGLNAVKTTPSGMPSPARGKLVKVEYHAFGGDLVVFADVEKTASTQNRLRRSGTNGLFC